MIGVLDAATLAFCLVAAMAVLSGLVTMNARHLPVNVSEAIVGLGVVAITAIGLCALRIVKSAGGEGAPWILGLGVAAFLLSVMRQNGGFGPQNDLLIGAVVFMPIGASLIV